jgi:hypothetical protein
LSVNGLIAASASATDCAPANSATLSSDFASISVAAIGATMLTLMSRPAASAVMTRISPISPVLAAP